MWKSKQTVLESVPYPVDCLPLTTLLPLLYPSCTKAVCSQGGGGRGGSQGTVPHVYLQGGGGRGGSQGSRSGGGGQGGVRPRWGIRTQCHFNIV